MACDMCGKKGCSLEPLNEQYKTKDIQNICSECSRLVDDKMWKIRAVTHGILTTSVKRFMANFK